MNKENELGNHWHITQWTPFVRKHVKNEGFSQFVDKFMYTIHINFHGESPPKFFPMCKGFLQLSPIAREGDWYLFESHTIMRIYGLELRLFLLPKYLTQIIFSLEYTRQRWNSYYIHFESNILNITFRLLAKLGTFLVIQKET